MKSKEINHRGYHADHPNMEDPTSEMVQKGGYEDEREFIIFEMEDSEENKVERDSRRVGSAKEIDLFKTVERGLRNTRDTVSVLNSNIEYKRNKQDMEVALPELVDSVQENLQKALTRLPGAHDGRVEVPFMDPDEADRYLDIAERGFREALEYLDKKAREEGLHQLEGQKHHFHGKYLSSNSQDYLDPEDYALFEIVDDALGIDLAPEDSDRAYVCDVEELGNEVNELFYDNDGELKRARAALPDTGYKAKHLDTDESLEINN